MEKKIELQLNQVSKSFARVEHESVTYALSETTLTLQSGEFVAIVGPSGCGKSTILRLIAGLIQPTTGEVLVNGKKVTAPGPDRGMVFQKPTLFPWLTVADNVGYSLKMMKRTEGRAEKIRQMLAMIGLEDFATDYPAQLSGGMAQRVALARSLIAEPDILLLDEPLGALDAFTRMEMQDEILRICQRSSRLAVMVTHDVDEAVYMATRVLVMEASPGQVRSDIPIQLDYPRQRSGDSFIRYRNQILETLHYGSSSEKSKEDN